MRRRLLLLCYFYPPLGGGGVHRVLGFTRHLPRYDWDCTVVCAGADDYWVRDDSLLERVRPDTEVLRVPGGSALAAWLRLGRGSAGRRSGRTFGRLRTLSDWWLLPDSYAGWAKRAARVARGRAARGDVHAVLSSSPPDSVHLAGRAVRAATGLPWVADFRDPWIGLHFRRPPTAWHHRRQAALERGVIEGADAVLAASGTHARGLRDTLGPSGRPERVTHLPNGFEPDPPRGPAVVDPDHFTMVFTGTLSLTPDTEVFLEALHDMLARRAEARRRVRVRLVGPYDSGYADRAEALGLTGIVSFLGPRPHAEARALQRGADALLLWMVRDFPSMVPGKIYEYLDAGRPLVAVLDPAGEAAEIARRGGAAIVPPGDRAALAAEIERLYTAWREGRPVSGARPEWLEDYTRGALAGRLAALLDGLCGARR